MPEAEPAEPMLDPLSTEEKLHQNLQLTSKRGSHFFIVWAQGARSMDQFLADCKSLLAALLFLSLSELIKDCAMELHNTPIAGCYAQAMLRVKGKRQSIAQLRATVKVPDLRVYISNKVRGPVFMV